MGFLYDKTWEHFARWSWPLKHILATLCRSVSHTSRSSYSHTPRQRSFKLIVTQINKNQRILFLDFIIWPGGLNWEICPGGLIRLFWTADRGVASHRSPKFDRSKHCLHFSISDQKTFFCDNHIYHFHVSELLTLISGCPGGRGAPNIFQHLEPPGIIMTRKVTQNQRRINGELNKKTWRTNDEKIRWPYPNMQHRRLKDPTHPPEVPNAAAGQIVYTSRWSTGKQCFGITISTTSMSQNRSTSYVRITQSECQNPQKCPNVIPWLFT
jgi:hypothetical protein